MSTKRVTLTVEVLFVGDYYELRELVETSAEWIQGALEDRDDLRTVSITGSAELISEQDLGR